eukprot:scaffold106266_cov15-Tisochrysis_lutea.AAC.2
MRPPGLRCVQTWCCSVAAAGAAEVLVWGRRAEWGWGVWWGRRGRCVRRVCGGGGGAGPDVEGRQHLLGLAGVHQGQRQGRLNPAAAAVAAAGCKCEGGPEARERGVIGRGLAGTWVTVCGSAPVCQAKRRGGSGVVWGRPNPWSPPDRLLPASVVAGRLLPTVARLLSSPTRFCKAAR